MALLEKPDVEHVASQDVLLRAATERVNDRGYIVAKLEEIVRWARSGLDSSTTPASETRGYGPSESKRVRNGLAAGGRWIRTLGPAREGVGLPRGEEFDERNRAFGCHS